MLLQLEERLNQVKNNIKEAAVRAQRDPEQIKLLPVSKTQPVEDIIFFYRKGIKTFGENKVQELIDKNEEIDNLEIDWHFIGHLQTNKVKYLLRINRIKMIESLDSWRLAQEIDKQAQKYDRIMSVLVEINISGDASKYGIKPEDTMDFVKNVVSLSNIKIQGLMTIASYVDDPEENRKYFREMAALKQKLKNAGYNFPYLSMGMSNDYQVAVEEGATMVRVGTALFGSRKY